MHYVQPDFSDMAGDKQGRATDLAESIPRARLLILPLLLEANAYYVSSPYRKENTSLHHYSAQLNNDIQGNNRYLKWESYET